MNYERLRKFLPTVEVIKAEAQKMGYTVSLINGVDMPGESCAGFEVVFFPVKGFANNKPAPENSGS